MDLASAMIAEALQRRQRIWVFGGDRRHRHKSIRDAAEAHGIPLYWVSARQLIRRDLSSGIAAVARILSRQRSTLVLMDWERVIAWHRLFAGMIADEPDRGEKATNSLIDEPEQVLTTTLGKILESVPVAVVISCATLMTTALRWFVPLKLEESPKTAGAEFHLSDSEQLHPTNKWEHRYIDYCGALEHVRRLLLPTEAERATWRRLSLSVPRCVIVYGPPASGKTATLNAFAELATERGLLGETERQLREFFRPVQQKTAQRPSILCFDDIDLLLLRGRGVGASISQPDCPTSTDRFASRLLGTLLSEFDGALGQALDEAPQVQLLLTATDLTALDAALLRPGRCDARIELTIPLIDKNIHEQAPRRDNSAEALRPEAPSTGASAEVSSNSLLVGLRQRRLVYWERTLAQPSVLSENESVGASLL
ncbi:AAA+-type ATPase [Cyanidiococcus yangmingshanensis]|uniref:AAA+-type ATPase n=1 Tax=Cyanidiococcus yangmingshanensis TaxID=2690220 RepID=A0A7J7IGD0_9RHOD|nr:AAA+-type ATPase [Cyanidiococcus yangmingshanensis]